MTAVDIFAIVAAGAEYLVREIDAFVRGTWGWPVVVVSIFFAWELQRITRTVENMKARLIALERHVTALANREADQ